MDKFIPVVLLVLLQVGLCLTDSCYQDQDCGVGDVCDDSKCYSRSSRIDCPDGISYCYKPTQCCGINTCCPAKSQCCGWNTCCAVDAVCCPNAPAYCCERGSTCCGFQTCCGSGSVCKDGSCVAAKASFKHWYIFLILFPVFMVLGCIIRFIRLKILNARNARLRDAGLLVQANPVVPVQNPEYGYDQPMGSMNYQLPTAPGVPDNSANQQK
ncbi:hypothetical protein ACF0H5_015597 [Mactra antiquata]